MAAKRSRAILHASLERVVEPMIALLRQFGSLLRQFGVRDIATLCSNNPKLLTFSLERVKEVLLRAEELGVPRNSRMFKYVVAAVACNSREKVAAKIEFFKRTLGCSESVVSIAVCRQPSILGVSDEKLIRKIEFLVNEVGMEPRYILERPLLLALSLEKRVLPRHRVLKVLQAKRLLNRKMNLTSFFTFGEKAFRLRFIDPHEDYVPDLAGYYATACAGDVPP